MIQLDLGFYVCRVLRHYSIDFHSILDLPLATFWMLNKNISRLLAEEDIRQMVVVAAPQSKDGYNDAFDRLSAEFGRPMIVEQVAPEEGGIERLKQLQRKGK